MVRDLCRRKEQPAGEDDMRAPELHERAMMEFVQKVM